MTTPPLYWYVYIYICHALYAHTFEYVEVYMHSTHAHVHCTSCRYVVWKTGSVHMHILAGYLACIEMRIQIIAVHLARVELVTMKWFSDMKVRVKVSQSFKQLSNINSQVRVGAKVWNCRWTWMCILQKCAIIAENEGWDCQSVKLASKWTCPRKWTFGNVTWRCYSVVVHM